MARVRIDFADSRAQLEADAQEHGLVVRRVLKPGLYHTRGLEYPVALLEGARSALKNFLEKFGYDIECHPITR